MKNFGVSGFTFCKNAVSLGYPIVESISSILPIVNEFVVNVGKSEDSTLESIEKIGNRKIRIIETQWDESNSKDGKVLKDQVNFTLSHCNFPWAFHLQIDEVVHEEDLQKLKNLMKEKLYDNQVLGFLFKFLHFHLDYWSLNPWGFRREVRIIRNDGQIRSAGDSCGFARKSDGLYLNKNLLGREVVWTGSRIFHYSSVMDLNALFRKAKSMVSVRFGDLPEDKIKVRAEEIVRNLVSQYEIMKEYRGVHPKVMEKKVLSSNRFAPRRSRWLNIRFYENIIKKGFKG